MRQCTGWRQARIGAAVCFAGMAAWPTADGAAEPSGAPRETGRIAVRDLKEISGLAASRVYPGILWLHNDGDSGVLYAVRASGEAMARLELACRPLDAEDLAIGPAPEGGGDVLFLADIGDNDSDRAEVRVWRVSEPDPGGAGGMASLRAVPDELILVYPDGPRDAEALCVDPVTGDLVVVAKEKKSASVYLAPAAELQPGARVALRKVAEAPASKVSGGDISRDGKRILLRTEDRGWLWTRETETPWAEVLTKRPEDVPVRGASQGENGEAVAIAADGAGYYTISEGRGETLWFFPLPPQR